ncbi:MAG: Ig-like domain-containing protein [Pseudomonadota bacterium]
MKKRQSLLGLASLGIAASATAGTFFFAEVVEDTDHVTHSSGYNINQGTPSNLTVNVCVIPGSPQAANIEVAVANVVDTINNLVPVPVNMKTASVFDTATDFESVALHEIGHCVGLAHPNAASEAPSGSQAERESTKSLDGSNNTLNYGAGGDGVHGSADDQRGDDVNLHFFNPASNDPFEVMFTVDNSNYSNDLADLPGGDAYAANADRQVAVLPRYSAAPNNCAGMFFETDQLCSEAIMQQGTVNAEFQRALGPDDVATLLYAQSGLDRSAGTGDDYTRTLVYRGITASNCDVNVSFDNSQTGFASCRAAASISASNSASVITEANAYFNTGTNFLFSTIRIPLARPDQANVSANTTTVVTDSVLDNDTNQEGTGTLEATTTSRGGPIAGTVTINTDGTFSYTNTNPAVSEDYFIYEVCRVGPGDTAGVNVTDACSHQVVTLNLGSTGGEVIFESSFEQGE